MKVDYWVVWKVEQMVDWLAVLRVGCLAVHLGGMTVEMMADKLVVATAALMVEQ